jgi:hypothetical protein
MKEATGRHSWQGGRLGCFTARLPGNQASTLLLALCGRFPHPSRRYDISGTVKTFSIKLRRITVTCNPVSGRMIGY